MKIQVFSRSCNDDLYGMMRKLIPSDIECTRCDNYRNWWEAREYLHHIINTGEEWVINIDDDAFIADWRAIVSLIKHMADNNIIYAGMPDGGVCPHRCRSWVVMNPYFTVFNAKAIREYIQEQQHPEWLINSCGLHPNMEERKPGIVKGIYNHDTVEPFSGLFYWLFTWAKPLFLNAHGHNDGVSTLLLYDNKPFIYHSWYSREFATDSTHRKRILELYDEARLHNSALQG